MVALCACVLGVVIVVIVGEVSVELELELEWVDTLEPDRLIPCNGGASEFACLRPPGYACCCGSAASIDRALMSFPLFAPLLLPMMDTS
jgi:predicted alternative tryptophan synthase beta-subunit